MTTTECIICFEVLETGTKTTKCNHIFHVHCIEQWLESKPTCPVCRTQLAESKRVMCCPRGDPGPEGVPGPSADRYALYLSARERRIAQAHEPLVGHINNNTASIAIGERVNPGIGIGFNNYSYSFVD